MKEKSSFYHYMKSTYEGGFDEGRLFGLEQGKEENIVETCLRMHDNGLDNDTISLCLNITKEKVEKIIKNNE